MGTINSGTHVFSSIEPEQLLRIAQQAGQASQGRYQNGYEEDYEEEDEDEYGDGNHPSSRYRSISERSGQSLTGYFHSVSG